jgi:hypothetical protein
MAAQRVGGIAYFKIDGAQFTIKGKFEVMPNNRKKTTAVGQSEVIGFTESPVAPGFKGTITDLGGVSVQQLQDLENSTMTLEQDNGKTWILRDGWLEGEISVNTEEGSYDAEFRGMDMQELTA